ncbi:MULTISPECIES: hypothetical protein [Kamptonema]|uniref:hypothetical protein n=1 Tax=Kamptonema TaxID=1501433 RepID=UPI0001DAC668|nr:MULTISPECIES: hypothetical protein [Kamptonema]CBN54338.1 hypothetical protein OSCI_800020 [Kamptonema sp. PCC 6506]
MTPIFEKMGMLDRTSQRSAIAFAKKVMILFSFLERSPAFTSLSPESEETQTPV